MQAYDLRISKIQQKKSKKKYYSFMANDFK